ncbi:MAG: acylneuraminate cytidylyltransferase family protein [Gemmatimonadaceae bacterium]
MRVLGLIPARGGSRGVPRKNLRSLGGRPLLAYTAQSALAATRLARVVLSTDDAEIAEVGAALGLDVPFIRPAELAADDTPMLPVVRHALDVLGAAGDVYDAVCLLQPTTPFRPAGAVDGCIAMLEASGADSVISVRAVPTHLHPQWTFIGDAEGFLTLASGAVAPPPRRQLLPPAYHRDGAVYVIRRATLDGGTILGTRVAGCVLAGAPAVNIDEAEDWTRAERWLARQGDPDSGATPTLTVGAP